MADSIATAPAAGGPYGTSALAYWNAGWQGVLPLPSGRKWPPPPGWTGYDGEYPSRADVQTWLDDERTAGGNVALRLPHDVLGLDVDAYPGKAGGRTLVDLTERLGPLPPTWSTTARDDGVSGIRLFHLPESAAGGHWKGEAGPGIEVIQWGHRYAIVAPSTNPDAAGASYRWVPGRPVGIARWPSPDRLSLPELPAAWVEYLLIPGERRVGAELDDESARSWLAACRGLHAGESGCPIVERTAAGVELGVGSRHEAARDAVHALVRLGGEGHAGVWAALVALREQFVEALAGERGRDAAGEWRRMLSGAVRLAAGSDREPRGSCGCATWTGELVGFDPGFPGEGGSAGEGARGADSGLANDANRPANPANEQVGALDPVDALIAEMLDTDQLDELPEPEWLVDGWLALDSIASMIGKSGHGKSFLAVDLACHVATGRAWHGRAVRQMPVSYMVAEGARGIRKRVRAWEKHHGVRAYGLKVLPRPVQSMGEEWPTYARAARRLEAGLVIADTQARITVGVNENDNSDMGEFVQRLEGMRRLTGACVLVVHHQGQRGDEGRGASAVKAAMTSELTVSRAGNTLTVRMTKQKDGPELEALTLGMQPVDLGVDAKGEPVDSIVLSGAFGTAGVPAVVMDDLTPVLRRVAAIMIEVFGEGLGATKAECRSICTQRGVAKDAFYRAWNRFIQTGRLIRQIPTQSYRFATIAELPEGERPTDGDGEAALASFLGGSANQDDSDDSSGTPGESDPF